MHGHVEHDNQKLKVLFSNVDSLSNKCSEFEAYLSLENPDVIGLCEILPKNAVDKHSIENINLNRYIKFVPSVQGERGVILFVKNSLKANKVKILENSYQEAIWCEIVISNSDKLLIGLVYRSPSSSAENNDKLISVINNIMGLNYTHYLFFCDFNFKEIDWNSLVFSRKHAPIYNIFELCS